MNPRDFLNKKSLTILGIIILILVLILFIFYIDLNTSPTKTTYTTDYKNLSEQIRTTYTYTGTIESRMGDEIETLGRDVTDEKKYKALQVITIYISSTYGETRNPKYRDLISEIDSFGKKYFSKYYKKGDFYTVCQDPSCAQDPQPEEIGAILDYINNSEIEEDYGSSISNNLLNTGFLPDKDKQLKFDQYYATLSEIRSYLNYSPSSSLSNVEKMMLDFLSEKYPEELKKAEDDYRRISPPTNEEILKNATERRKQ